MTAAAAPQLWKGPYQHEGTKAFLGAREDGMSVKRAIVLGHAGSFKDCFAFRKTIAKWAGCSVRTVQRAFTEARQKGRNGTARAKPGEIPPGCDTPIPCGWSHRWTIGWGKVGKAVADAVNAARARWIVKHAVPSVAKAPDKQAQNVSARPARPEYQRRKWTADELNSELERLGKLEPREKPPPS